ncbi:hypothetical protein R1sor_019009 [Riccia sorocarpa]|uniref:Uncharacterized protein n=1 Tax=Riccia sorocarpa TaxID=122646 RepID=A0ABD3IE19_9MARC
MWPQPERVRWNQAGDAIFTTFLGWIPLPHAEGGTKDLPAMCNRAQCYVCQNYFGPEGGYVPGTCQHHEEDRSGGYNLRDEAVNMVYFYPMPSKAPEYCIAEYIDDLVHVIELNWPPECWNYRGYRQSMVQPYNEVILSDSDDD